MRKPFRWRGFLHTDDPQAGNGLGADAWSGFDLTGLEGDAEPPKGGQDLVKTKSYVSPPKTT